MMIAEIVAGTWFADGASGHGWYYVHHAGRRYRWICISLARKHAHDPRFTFGTVLGELAGFVRSF
jgi:hypothetical protein